MLTLDAFARLIRRLRTEKGLSQQQLADLLFVTRKTIGNWEAGSCLPDVGLLSRLARLLGVETYVLLDAMYGEDSPPAVLAVDAQPERLHALLHTLRAALPGAQILAFRSGAEALRFAAGTPAAAAFLDAEAPDSLLLAQGLQALEARCNLFFLADSGQYALSAWEVHASGYLLRPLTAEKLRRELGCLRFPVNGLRG